MIAKQLQATFEFAVNEALTRRHEYVTLEHLLFALLHDRDAVDVVRACGGDVEELKKQLDDFMSKTFESLPDETTVQPVLTTMLQRVVHRNDRALCVRSRGHALVRDGQIVIACNNPHAMTMFGGVVAPFTTQCAKR